MRAIVSITSVTTSGWKLGDHAVALLAGGGYAEEVVVNAGSVLHAPSALSDKEAGRWQRCSSPHS